MSPCSWPVSYSDAKPCSALSADPTVRSQAETMATEFLWRWTGRQFGLCPVTIRPCRQNCYGGLSTFTGGEPRVLGQAMGGLYSRSPFYPMMFNGEWLNVACGRCGNSCDCGYTPSISLPGPIDSITEVVVNGVALPATAYRVDNYRHLLRIDGGDWPTCQDLSADSAAGSASASRGTWQVTYQRGSAVPAGGQVAAGLLACEFAKALVGDAGCKLPQRVQSITRQGVTVAVLDTFADLDKGRTGIWLIDSWVASIMKPAGRSRVYSPDLARPRNRRRTS
jgi:hypothetical protein